MQTIHTSTTVVRRRDLERTMRLPQVQRAMYDAWSRSFKGGTVHEEGFWVMWDGSVRLHLLSPAGAHDDEINGDSGIPKRGFYKRAIFFHTHPFTYGEMGPSGGDIFYARDHAVSGVIKSPAGMYYYGQ